MNGLMLFKSYRSYCRAHCGGIDVTVWLAGALQGPHDGIVTVLAATNAAGSILRLEPNCQLHVKSFLERDEGPDSYCYSLCKSVGVS